MTNKSMTPLGRRNGQPSWGYLIVLALCAIALINLLAITIVLLMQPTPERHWFLVIIWIIAVVGLSRLPRIERAIEARRKSPRR